MKLNQLTPAILLIALSLTTSLNAQVTIGSGQPPATGALLDLKQEGTTTKGMVLPRVKLANVDALTMGTNVIANANNAWTNHAGLVVYNISGITPAKCAPIPDGLYVWDGAKWNGINTPTPIPPATLDVGSKLNFDFPSGRDLRPLAAQSFTATWSPANPLTYTNTPHTTLGGLSFTTTPLTASPLATSPVIFSMTPDAMTPAEITTNPFHTKESTLIFDAKNECGAITTKSVAINQTNKALTVQTPFKEATANSSETNGIKSNAQWKLKSIVPNDNTNAIFNAFGVNTLKIDGNSLTTASPVQGEEKNDNAGKDGTLSYDIIVGATKARYSVLTFEDAAATKRFSDVTITVLQCPNAGVLQPSIEQWALTAGFTQAQINTVKTTGADSPILPTGIQLHRDQSNNLFLSSSFHSTNITGNTNTDRWMIHNLAATRFDAGQAYTGGATLVNKGLRPYDADGVPPGTTATTMNANAYKNPYYAYPNGGTNNGSMTATTYDNNQRLGLLYTWDAATAGKGGTNGQADIIDGEPATHAAVQGICPDGWHLPSDVEWTQLEQEINTNTTSYSSATANANGAIGVGSTGWRGLANNANGHGNAMKEQCEPGTGVSKGTSNSIGTSARPGFDVLLAGNAAGGSAYNFGANGDLWPASGAGAMNAWRRNFNSGNSQVYRFANYRSLLISVRCKK